MVGTTQTQAAGESHNGKFLGVWGCGSVAGHMPSMHGILRLSPSATKIAFLFVLIYLTVLTLKSDSDRDGMVSTLGAPLPQVPVRDERGPQPSAALSRVTPGEAYTQAVSATVFLAGWESSDSHHRT